MLSGALLVLTGPVLLGCALALRVMDGPGVVFRQERIGRDGRPFTMLKLRTHRPASEHEAATRWSVANQQDMSRFCHFLRRTSLDELLQLWNVFRGDMSLVGPRPERPYFVAQFSQAHPGYPERHRMRTGITGLAQINGLRGDTSIEDRARYDNAYIDDWSLWQDVCVLLRTAAQFVRPTGS